MKILVAYDGSNAAKEALSIAEMHANALKAEIILVQSMVGGPEVPRKDFEHVENNLEYEKSLLLDKKIPCKPILSVRGLEAGEDLVQLADEHKADEIIIPGCLHLELALNDGVDERVGAHKKRGRPVGGLQDR